MAKMVISLVIEGQSEELHNMKGQMFSMFGDLIVSASVNEIKEQKKELEIPACMFIKR